MASSKHVDDDHVARKLEELYEFASECGERELLDMFNRKYVRGMICGEYNKAEPRHIIERLQKAHETRLELHRLENEMDQDLFKTLVTSGNVVRSGRDQKDGLVTFWHSANAFTSNRKARVDSPQGKAYVRAIVWSSETMLTQTIDKFGSHMPTHSLCVDLYSGILEFNPAITEHGLRLLKDLIPIQDCARIYMFGVPRMVPWIFNCICRMIPAVSDKLLVMQDYDDALDIVDDPHDVPDFWICSDSTPDSYAMMRTSTWCYERCLGEANRVTTKDVFNPGEWPYPDDEEIDHSRVTLTNNKPTGLEGIIEEDEDEDEEGSW